MFELLVTSPLTECVIPGKKILFLGNWCLPSSNPCISVDSGFLVAKPFGADYRSINKLADYSNAIYSEALVQISKKLNIYHSVNYGTREWEIILGHWLRRYIRVMINRFETIKQVLNDCEDIKTVELICTTPEWLSPPKDSNEALIKFRNPLWNYSAYLQALKILNNGNVTFISKCFQPRAVELSLEPINRLGLKKILKYFNLKISKLFSHNDAVFIINPYLGKIEELLLHVRLGQLPKIFRYEPKYISNKYDPELRKNLCIKVSNSTKDDRYELTKYVYDNLFLNIPISFVEDFKSIKDAGNNSILPIKPKCVITANSFDTDDFFKIWLAEKITKYKTKYFAIQHGGGYGTSDYINPISVEEATSDKFITWGWQKGDKYYPAGIFNNKRIPKISYNPRSLKVLVVMAVEREPFFLHDINYEFNKYFDDLLKLYSQLDESVKKYLVFRLGPNYKIKKQREDLRLIKYDPNIKIDDGSENIYSLYASSRLVIQTTNSTSFLETLFFNIPTIGIFDINFVDINKFSKDDFLELEAAGLIHFNLVDAAKFINTNFNIMSEWWFSKKVQTVRDSFVRKFAKLNNRTDALIKLIKS